MQLDRTRIAIRERGYLDILDLALCVIRAHAGGLLVATLVGVAPMFALNWWLISDIISGPGFEIEGDAVSDYIWKLLALTFLEMPLAAAPATLYLGQALFLERPNSRQMVRDLLGSLPQMTLLQLGPRALVILPAVLFDEPVLLGFSIMALLGAVPLHYALWPYLTEIILLERNRLFRASKQGTSTWRRVGALHNHYRIELFGHWLMALVFGGAWIAALWLAQWSVWTLLVARLTFAGPTYTVLLPAALWLVISFFTVARYLGYLDLRIRTEGWEIELRMRAEAQRLTRTYA
jgi:hypothetical protein